MKRGCFYLRLYPGTEGEYDRRHVEIWPELSDAIRSSGIRNMSGFRRGTDVWYYAESDVDVSTAFRQINSLPISQEWSRSLRSVIAESSTPAGDNLWYEEIFHHPGENQQGEFKRGLLLLVIDPEKGAAYDARHAEPWPDMLEAITLAGSMNSVGFRREGQVLFYGEHYPDLVTVYERITQYEVDARWGASFEDLITTMTDENEELILATEIFHLD